MDETNVELQEPQAFVAAAIILEVCLAGRLVYQVCKHGKPMRSMWRRIASYAMRMARSLVPFSDDSDRKVCIHEEVRALRWYISRKIVALNLTMLLVIVGLIQMRVVFQLPATIQGSFCWTLLGTFGCMCAAFIFPRITRTDLSYLVYSCLLMLYILPMNSSTAGTTRVAPLLFTLFRLPATAMVNRIYFVLLGNLPFLAIMTWRVSSEDFDNSYGGRTAAVGMECLHILVLVGLAVALQDYLCGRVEKEQERSNTVTQLNAASSLLQLTCDAVVELDGDLRLTKHSQELSAMLLRDAGRGASLEGVRFTDLVPASEAAGALKQLTHFRSTAGSGSSQLDGMCAHAFHTRLIDSCATRLQTEVLQVMYSKRDGATCHLVGLRDFTDTKPYTSVDSVPHLGDDVMSPVHSLVSLSSLIAPTPADYAGSEACQLPLQRGTLFLEIDVDGLLVHAASSSLVDLVGAPACQVFPASHTIQLLERIHSDGRMRLERGERPPAKVFSYEDLPAHLHPFVAAEFICGTMQVVQAQTGLNVLMAFQVAHASRAASLPHSRRSSRSHRDHTPRSSIRGGNRLDQALKRQYSL